MSPLSILSSQDLSSRALCSVYCHNNCLIIIALLITSQVVSSQVTQPHIGRGSEALNGRGERYQEPFEQLLDLNNLSITCILL